MGQCVSRGHPGPYSFSRHYDAESLASGVTVIVRKGHSESKGAKRSTEDLRGDEVLSGRSTPLARPRKETAGQPLRTNRFGFRQPHAKTAKVADVIVAAEPAFGATHKDKETAINNNALDKKSTNSYNNQLPLLATQVSSTGVTTIVGAAGIPKTVTKQTVILTYQPQQYLQEGKKPVRFADQCNNRGASTTRVQGGPEPRLPGKYTFQTNQLPKPQYPAIKTIDAKATKQVVNNTRKASTSDGWREGAGSAVSTDSGVWTGGEGPSGGELSPHTRRRPRNLEMVMRGAHSFHLRELQVADLDIMDEAVVTGHTVIPLPKLPSSFDDDSTPEYEVPAPTYQPPSPILPKPVAVEISPKQNSPMSTLERYRNRNRPTRIQANLDEEKFVLDRAQPEKLNKQNSFIKSSSGVSSPTTIDSSKESSPSCKSEESHFGNSSTWQSHAAGEAMATRSQDDVSIALSVSSCEDDKSKYENKEAHNPPEIEVPTKTIVIMDEPPVPHPLLMKSITLSQHDSLRGTMMGSMTSSNYSTTSTCTNQSGDHHNLTLTLEESKFDMSALETSTQSLLDDETSPADSLISSTSTSDSNNELQVEREPPSISSAYQTANTKTRTPEPIVEEMDRVDGECLQPVKEVNEVVRRGSGVDSGSGSKNVTPESPGTPTHASVSLSLSDGRDYFDDEIADQPALLFRKNTDGSPSSKTVESETSKHIRKSRDRITSSPLAQRNRKLCGGRNGATERTASLDTLSSLASDDLMMDNDLAQSITSLQSVDDYIERLDSSLRSGLNSLDERQLRQELSSSKTAVRQWSQLLEQNNMLDRQLAAMAQGKSASDSLTASNNSLTNIGASLPVRTARLLQRSRTQTPSEIGVSEGSASPSPAPASLLQDVVDIKTLLLQLKRVLQEPGEEHHSMSSETLDPLLAACAESPARGNGRRPPASPLHPDACAEMRRQILYLQSQLEERDRLVRVLQQQMLRMAESHEPRTDDTCNVATQTDRLRPPMGSTLTSSDNSGLVSWNEQASARKLPSYSEAQKTKRPVTNGTVVKCQCSGKKVNGINGDDNGVKDKRIDVHLKTNSRVGSKYLQALANTNIENRRYVKRDSSVGSNERKTLYSNRSRSIENFTHHQTYSTNESRLAKNAVIEEPVACETYQKSQCQTRAYVIDKMETRKMSVRARLAEEIYTYCAFWIAVSTLPALALSYVVVRVSKHLWLKLLSSRYPDLEYIRTDTIRSLLDTHRNQGIINVLLAIKGTLNTNQIKEHLTLVIEKKDKDGQPMFPRLQNLLVSCWGNYAWDANVEFKLENHVIIASAVYRGRPVTDTNIQEYVSDIVSKYFPSDQPPWQYIIIPSTSIEPKYYVLVRVHHLLLTGKKSLNIGDFLLVEPIPPAERISQEYSQQSPLSKLYPNPSAIPELWEKLNENLSNAWNEFVSEYDPVESPRALKTLPGAFHVAGLLLISSVSALRELTKKYNGRDTRLEGPITATTLLAAIQRECKRRSLTVPKIFMSPLVTIDPRKWPRRAVNATLSTTRMIINLPLRIKDEIVALNELTNSGQVNRPNTLTWKYAELAQLCARASAEAWRGLVEVYRAPAKLWTDTIRTDVGPRHLLQTVSLCGRKVAWWSRPVSRAGVERAARALGVSCTDIALFAATDALRAFFEHAQAQSPETILTTARAADEHFLFTFAEGQGKLYKKSHTGGMICLSLPVGATPRRIAAVVGDACARQGALWGAWAAQARCGALTRALPSPIARLTLNLLSRRYAVSYAEINSPADAMQRTTLWGHTVDAVMYWRPPQANISMSLTVIQYADTIRLCVMTDSRLSPAHTVPANRWPVAVEQLVTKVDQEIARIAASVQIPQVVEGRKELEDTSQSKERTESSGSLLRPPSPTTVSPPMRRRIAQ
ncbi:hypothetical protein K1T71_005685 [Dendrolimus kikuchii]|uniref:Uncharacterized protein n=1 Tax=Dendrolimus kikuchii TaxID=765133 RepID=A0ACC1D534_9NEOP|nr:hypothetical protein K1T71_005685 [Dendrolimus kikuchii]